MLGSVIQRKTTALFKLFDMNGDGYWERSDFEQFVERLARAQGLEPGSEKLDAVSQVYMQIWDGLRAADADGDGRVTVEEALSYQEQTFTPEVVTGFARVVFPTLDHDGDGAIGPEEYRQYLSTSPAFDTTAADETFRRLDTDGDGRITAAEFEQLYLEYFLSDDPDAPGSSLWGPF
ncbi:MAG TPA: EF-hand domain-containing protein [Acidimicrobiales bacterium]